MTTILAPASFALNITAMIWALVAQPDLQTISDRNPCAFTPSNPMIGVIFAMQTLASAYWLHRARKLPTEEDEEAHSMRVSYTVPFIIANMYLATWAIFWHREWFIASGLVLFAGVLVQAFFVYQTRDVVLPMDTYVLSRLFLGIGILDVLQNGAIALEILSAGTMTKVFTGVVFIGTAAVADPLLCAILCYDLLALIVGQSGSWRKVLAVYAGVVGLVAAGKAFRAKRAQVVEL